MSGLKNRKSQELQKPFQGCIGGMVNVFDLSAGMGGTKLLTNKALRDGSPSRRSHADIKNSVDPVVLHAEGKQITSEMRKSSSTKRSGGRTSMKMLLAQEMSKEIESERKQPNVVARLMGLDEALPSHQSVLNHEKSLEKSSQSSRVTLAGALQNSRQLEAKYSDYAHKKENRDVYEIPKQPPRNNQKVRYDEVQNERKMALVRQKFTEAKRLAIDQRFLHSKEFQDALEVLSSNRDLFLTFLEEPHSLISNNFEQLHSTPAAHQRKKIALLKPSRIVETKCNTQGKKQHPQRNSTTTQPTRIVILKPSLVMYRERYDFDRVSETNESVRSREAAKDIAREMMESVRVNRREESLLSSVLSNGYVGDESSFDRSEKSSNSETPTQASHHSWDSSNFPSSFSRASYSPEPPVSKEAKQRLSERWSNINNRERTELKRTSSTLGEMLAIPQANKVVNVASSKSYGGEEDMCLSSASSSTYQTKDGDGGERSNCNLSRSKSLPVSSAYENIGLNSVPTKSKSGRSSLKGKVSSLFFSKNKKGGREKSVASPGMITDPVGKEIQDLIHPVNCDKDEPRKESSHALVKGASKQGSVSFRDILSLDKASTSESDPSPSPKIGNNQNQISPTSVLDAPFVDDSTNNTPNTSEIPDSGHSSQIESVARTLSWDDTNIKTSLTDTSDLVIHLPKASAEFVRNILSTAELDFTRWHSVEIPLDSSLLDKFFDGKEEDSKSRERRSDRRFLFDCINSALLELGRTAYSSVYPWYRVYSGTRKKTRARAFIGDEVLMLISEWLCSEEKLESGEIDDGDFIVDRLLKRGVEGSGWLELMQSEIDEIGKGIGREILEELVEEALKELTLGSVF